MAASVIALIALFDPLFRPKNILSKAWWCTGVKG